LGYWSLGNIW